MKSVVFSLVIGLIVGAGIERGLASKVDGDAGVRKQDKVDLVNDQTCHLHFGDRVRFKHGFYSGMEGHIEFVNDDRTFGVIPVEHMSAPRRLHLIDNVRPETLEVVQEPTPAPDLFDARVK